MFGQGLVSVWSMFGQCLVSVSVSVGLVFVQRFCMVGLGYRRVGLGVRSFFSHY